MLNSAFFLGSLLLLSLWFMTVGFWKRQYFLTLASGVGFMLFGLFLLSGISYPILANSSTLSNVSGNLTSTDVVYTYGVAVWPVPYNPWTSMFFILSGVVLLFVAVFEFFKPQPIGGGEEE